MTDACWIAFWLLAVQGVISLVQWWTTAGTLKAMSRTIRFRMPDKLIAEGDPPNPRPPTNP